MSSSKKDDLSASAKMSHTAPQPQVAIVQADQIDRSIPPTDFVLFSTLSIELRLKIWKLTAPGGRMLFLKWKWIKYKYSNHNSGSQITSNTPVPVILHICRESREEALKIYALGLGTIRKQPTIYVDYLRDTLYFGTRLEKDSDSDETGCGFTLPAFIQALPEEELGKIRYFSVEWAMLPGPNGPGRPDDDLLAILELPALAEFRLALQRPGCYNGKAVKFTTATQAELDIIVHHVQVFQEVAARGFWGGSYVETELPFDVVFHDEKVLAPLA